MKLNECLRRIHMSQNVPSDWTIRFQSTKDIGYGERYMIPTTIGIDDLYNDWYKNCDYCPENGKFVFGITIAQESTGKCFLIETSSEYTFEELMMAIEEEFYPNRNN